MSLIVADGAEQLKGRLEVFANLTDRSQVTASIAVVGCTPHGDDILVGKVVLVPFVDQLMRASDQGEIVDMAEFIRYTITEQPTWEKENVSGLPIKYQLYIGSYLLHEG